MSAHSPDKHMETIEHSKPKILMLGSDSAFSGIVLRCLLQAGTEVCGFVIHEASPRSRAFESLGNEIPVVIAGTGPTVTVDSGLARIREIGHLSAFKVYTKEIVTETKHDWGDLGSRYLTWILSSKKMAMIFEFEIDCRYDLRSPDMTIEDVGDRTIVVKMPSCLYEVHLQNIRFYDEQHSRFLPWLLPDLVNTFFSTGFTEDDKNRLVAAAKNQAEVQARSLIHSFLPMAEDSAKRTLEAIFTSLGAREVIFDFARPDKPNVEVLYEAAA